MELITTHPIKKSDLGFHGNLFGGKLLSWLDAAAVAYAMQLCDSPRMVTVSIDKCVFEKPTKEGRLLKIFGYPAEVGNTSVTLYIEARSHNVRTGRQDVVLKKKRFSGVPLLPPVCRLIRSEMSVKAGISYHPNQCH